MKTGTGIAPSHRREFLHRPHHHHGRRIARGGGLAPDGKLLPAQWWGDRCVGDGNLTAYVAGTGTGEISWEGTAASRPTEAPARSPSMARAPSRGDRAALSPMAAR